MISECGRLLHVTVTNTYARYMGMESMRFVPLEKYMAIRRCVENTTAKLLNMIQTRTYLILRNQCIGFCSFHVGLAFLFDIAFHR